jgi:hypothetical protein
VTSSVADVGAGYANAAYAEALGEFGRPVALPSCGGWLLERSIPGFGDMDAMGPYPLFACRNWAALGQDLDALRDRLVSVTLAADPFGNYTATRLGQLFDRVRPLKNHFVVELSRPMDTVATAHHRYYARRALKKVQVDVSRSPLGFAEEWTRLYSGLVERHDIGGLRRFSPASFAGQLQVPGVVFFRALLDGNAVGSQIWYESGTGPAEAGAEGGSRAERVAYSHLAASSEAGYDVSVSYALYWAAIEYFRGRVDWLDLGAGAGVGERLDGLTAFKSGWATGSRPVYLCGRVLLPERYAFLAGRSDFGAEGYFPAYRAGEFAGRDK